MEERTFQGYIYRRASPNEAWQQVGPAPQAQAGRVVADPYRAPEEARKNEDQGFERERLRLSQVAEARAQAQAELEARVKAVELAEKERVAAAGGLSADQAQGAESKRAALDTLVEQLNRVQQLYSAGPGLTKGFEGLADYNPTDPANARLNTASTQLSEQGLGAFRVPGVGSQSDMEFAAFVEANRPSSYSLDARNEEVLRGLRSRIDGQRKAYGMAPAAWDTGLNPESGYAGGGNGEPIEVNVTGGYDPAAPSQGSYQDSLLGQTLYGVNEGLASTLGFPVDAVTAGLNLIPTGINAIANTNIGQIENPVAGGEWWRDLLTDVGSIAPESQSAGRPFVRRVGQSLGAAAIPIVGTATSAARAGAGALSALGGGNGGGIAQEVAPGNVYADLAGDVIGSGLTGAGLFGMARRGAMRNAEAAVPTVDQLKRQASDLYDVAESRGVVAGPNLTTNLAQRAQQIARDEVAITPTGAALPGYEATNSSLSLLGDYSGGNMSAKEIDRVRRVLSGNIQKAGDSNERRIARSLLNAFDDETLALAPEFSDARNVASRYLQAEEINTARDLADVRAGQFSQSGPENALRTDFRALDRNIVKGDAQFAPAVEEAIRTTARGDKVTNALRQVGKLAPRGVVSMGLSSGVPFAIGNAVGGPAAGAAFSATTMAGGELAARAAASRTIRNAEIAELLARNGGSITPDPVLDDELTRQIAATLASQLNAPNY